MDVEEIRKLMHGIPGYLAECEAVLLAQLAAGGVVMEIGSYQGLSTRVLATYARRVIAIDHFHPAEGARGYDPAGPGIRAVFEANLGPLLSKVEVYEMRSQEALLRMWEPLDLLFVDGGHDAATVAHDCGFCEWVKVGGHAAFHDYGRPEHPQVQPAVDAEIGKHGDWASCSRVGFLQVYERRP